MKNEKKPVIEMEDGVKRQGDVMFIPTMHAKWPGLRGNQKFVPLNGGMLVAIATMTDQQRVSLGLPAKDEAK